MLLSCCLAQYEEGSAPALALKATMERTEKRFKNYGDAGLLCGTDGLPTPDLRPWTGPQIRPLWRDPGAPSGNPMPVSARRIGQHS